MQQHGSFGRFAYFPDLNGYAVVPEYPTGGGAATNNAFALSLNNPAAPSCSITPVTLGPYTVGNVLSQTMTALNCGGGTLTWTSSALPTGASGCNSVTGTTCSISGTLSAAGTFTPTIAVSDGGSNSASIGEGGKP